MIKKITTDLISKISDFNKTMYESKINDQKYHNNLLQNFWDSKKQQNTLEITNFNYQEQLTSLTSSPFHNTISYYANFATKEQTELFKITLTSINQRIKDIVYNGLNIINMAQNNVMADDLLENYINDLQLEYLTHYWEIITNKLGSNIISPLLENSLSNLSEFKEYLDKKNNLIIKTELEIIHRQLNKYIYVLLKKLYAKFKLKPIDQQFTNNKKFHDFEDIDLNFNNNINEIEAYKILKLNFDASITDIKSSYRHLAKIYHPDNQKTGDELIMQRILAAYNLLKIK
ncbi:J domain-containing protein [Mesoplasma photuris]|uniref:J domain-containing protein n=1 Tax=Mesoplasma photuris TaxID=217731 RepID=UPI0004E15666|nr:J domain-containing protein [Mesoplasma photuris]